MELNKYDPFKIIDHTYLGLNIHEFKVFLEKHPNIRNMSIGYFEDYCRMKGIKKFIVDKKKYQPSYKIGAYGCRLLEHFVQPSIIENVFPVGTNSIGIKPIKIPQFPVHTPIINESNFNPNIKL